jgi:hypothetical protein
VLEEDDSLAAESASEEDENRPRLESSARLAGAGCFAVLEVIEMSEVCERRLRNSPRMISFLVTHLARLRRVVRRIPLAGLGRVMRY